MIRWLLSAALLVSVSTPAFSQPDAPPFASRLTSNVARLRAGDRMGFGFIVGLGDRALIVATARHTFDASDDGSAEVCFLHRGETCARGKVLYVADAIGSKQELDLAFVSVPYPMGLPWRPDVDAGAAALDAAVHSIGRAGEWYVPARAGRVTGRDARSELVTYRGLSVAEGVSGAPIVSEQGIVAMHVRSLGDATGAQGITMPAVRARLEQDAHVEWLLVPRATCANDEAHRAVLAARRITVAFPSSAPGAAMQTAARLHCLGADVVLAPVWDNAAWKGNGITYGAGGLRLVRALQSVLASLGRLDTSLGTPTGDAEIRIR